MTKTKKKTKGASRAEKPLPTTWTNAQDTLALVGLQHRVRLLEDAVGQQARTGVKYRAEHDKLMLSTGGLWRTKAGDVLQVRDMDDIHLENAIRSVREQGKSDPYGSGSPRRTV